MTTYDPTLPTDADWVRFLIGDTGDPSEFHDEEITAFIDAALVAYGPGAWIKYFVAADLMDALTVRWSVAKKGISSKSVSKLSISYGGANDLLAGRANGFRVMANTLLMPQPQMFAVCRTPPYTNTRRG